MKLYTLISEKGLRMKLNLFIGYTSEELDKFLEDRGYEPLKEKGSDGICFVTGKEEERDVHAIAIFHKEWTLETQMMLVHEVCHFVRNIMIDKGMKIEDETANEVFAYLVEYFCYEASRIINLKEEKENGKTKGKNNNKS